MRQSRGKTGWFWPFVSIATCSMAAVLALSPDSIPWRSWIDQWDPRQNAGVPQDSEQTPGTEEVLTPDEDSQLEENPFEESPFFEEEEPDVTEDRETELARSDSELEEGTNPFLEDEQESESTVSDEDWEEEIVPAGFEEEPTSGRIDLERIEELNDQGSYQEAYELLNRWFFEFPEQRSEFQKELDDVATRIYLMPQPHVQEPYVIQPGDQLRVIARKYELSWEYLARINKLDPKKIRPKQKLKVIQGPFDILVTLNNFQLIVTCQGKYVRTYRVGLGKDDSTPIGEFQVQDKLANPTYYGPDGVIDADDPMNPLGEHWIDIGDSYGIHGTIEENSIGKKESRGCIRLLNSDVAELYDFLTTDSKVVIKKK